MTLAPSSHSGFVPVQPLLHLDALWLQVAGSRCNLACTHCFVSCGPEADHHGFLTREAVAAAIDEARPLGLREVYFTGGEPFLHRDLEVMLAGALRHAACTVLTNGTLLTRGRVAALRALAASARWALEIRVSLDGATAADHDAVRGDGAFARALAGLRRLDDAGLLPIVTVTRHDESEDPLAFRERHVAMLRAHGIARPRLKVLPLFRLGRERDRGRDYEPAETLAGLGNAFDRTRLPCGSCRAVTTRGVFPCPLLVDEPRASLGAALADARGPVTLDHGACFTCWVSGSTCGNA